MPLRDGDRVSLGDESVTMQFIDSGTTIAPDPADIVTPTETYLDA